MCEGKDFGYVIDYYGDNLSNLNNALATYAHMDSFDEEDIEGTLTDISEEIAKLPQVHSDLWDIFKTIVNKYDNAAYLELLRDESLRSRFYEKLSAFARLLKMALSSIDFANKTPETLIKKYKDDAKFFIELQTRVKWEYLDTLDLRKYENEIRKLIDKHLTTEGEVQKITGLLNIFDENRIEAEMEKQASKAAKADHIAAKMNKEFSVDMDKDSNYHKKLATLIQETIDAYRAKRISEAEYYQKMTSYEQEYQDFKTGKRSDVPEPLIDNIAAIAFYGQVQTIFESSLSIAQSKEIAIEAALVIEEVYKNNVFANGKPIVDLRNKTDLLNKVGTELGDEVYDLFLKYDITLDWKDIDTLVDECQRIAIANYK